MYSLHNIRLLTETTTETDTRLTKFHYASTHIGTVATVFIYLEMPHSVSLFWMFFHQRCAMLRCCECVWFSLIIFIGTHSLALVETESAKLFFTWKDACYEWMYGSSMRCIDSRIIDTSHTRSVHLLHAATLRRRTFIPHRTCTAT